MSRLLSRAQRRMINRARIKARYRLEFLKYVGRRIPVYPQAILLKPMFQTVHTNGDSFLIRQFEASRGFRKAYGATPMAAMQRLRDYENSAEVR